MHAFRVNLFAVMATLVWVVVTSIGAVAAEQAASSAQSNKVGAGLRGDDPVRNLQMRLKDRVANGVSIEAYAVALAQAWIDYARESYFRKDRRASLEASIEARSVIENIEREGIGAKVDARLIASSVKLRDDLWRKAATFKRSEYFTCATWHTARLELALIAAGRASNDMGWRAARPGVRRAERFAREAEAKIDACAEPKPAIKAEDPSVAKPGGEEVIVTPPQGGTTIDAALRLGLPDRVHFARESAEISDVSALVLEQVSYVMRAHPAIVLDLLGYADELSGKDDNEKLALARSQGVRDYLVETGVGRERLAIRPGATSSNVGATALERAKARRVEFVPTSSEGAPLEYQDKDLPTEGPSGT